jgi:hypothetical protein
MVFHLPPHELQETPQANSVTLRRDRGRDKAAGLSWQYEKKLAIRKKIPGDRCRPGTL